MGSKQPTKEEQQIIEQMRANHGTVRPLRIIGQLVVVRMANPAELDRYNDAVGKFFVKSSNRRQANDVSHSNARRTFALNCICWPEARSERSDLLDRRPGMYSRIAEIAEELAEDDCEDLEGN